MTRDRTAAHLALEYLRTVQAAQSVDAEFRAAWDESRRVVNDREVRRITDDEVDLILERRCPGCRGEMEVVCRDCGRSSGGRNRGTWCLVALAAVLFVLVGLVWKIIR